jgi:HNH endonuclease
MLRTRHDTDARLRCDRRAWAIVGRQKLPCYNRGMSPTIASLTHLSDTDLLSAVTRAAAEERATTTNLIALLAEVDARRLYLGEGCSSLFTYCTQVLQLSEHAAYGRIEAARAARRFPVVLDRLAEGALTLTTVGLLAPHLTVDNAHALLTAACHKSKREVEHLVAALRPLPPVPSSVRKLPSRVASGVPTHSAAPAGGAARGWQADEAVPPPRDVSAVPVAGPAVTGGPVHVAAVTPLAPERYKVQFTVSRDTYDKLRRAQDLLRQVIPNGDPGAIFERAISLLVADLEKTRLASTTHPQRPRKAAVGSRHVPAAVKRQVWARDNGQCAFVGTRGRCAERGCLEIHHVIPFAAGGPTTTENLELRCRAHNTYEAEQFFGSSLLREARPEYSVNSVRPDLVGSAVSAAHALCSG